MLVLSGPTRNRCRAVCRPFCCLMAAKCRRLGRTRLSLGCLRCANGIGFGLLRANTTNSSHTRNIRRQQFQIHLHLAPGLSVRNERLDQTRLPSTKDGDDHGEQPRTSTLRPTPSSRRRAGFECDRTHLNRFVNVCYYDTTVII